MKLHNDTKILFCIAFEFITEHALECEKCAIYLKAGDGDLCDHAKEIIANNLADADTKPILE